MQLETETAQLKEENVSFRYTLNSEMTSSNYNASPSLLCEHHRKKLSDLFLIRHLTGLNDNQTNHHSFKN